MTPSQVVPGRQTLLVVLVAGLVLTSGCAGLLGDDDNGGEDTPDVDDGANGSDDGDTGSDDGDSSENGDDMENGDDDGDANGDDGDGDGEDTGSENGADDGDGNGADDGDGNGADDGDGDAGDDDTDPVVSDGTANLDSVPATADVVMFVDGAIIQHGTTATLVDGSVELNENAESLNDLDGFEDIDAIEDGDTYQDALDAFAAETGTDLSAFNSLTLFGPAETDPGAAAEANDQAGIIVDTDWTWEEITAAADVTVDEQFQEQRTYSGVTVYVNRSNSGSVPTWVADVGDGTFILGDEPQVKAAIDTRQGNNPGMSDDLRNAYESIGDGFIKAAVNVNESTGGQSAEPQTVTMRYGATGDTIRMTVGIEMATRDQASQVPLLVEFALAEVGGEDAPPDVQEATETLVNSISTSTDGTTATVEFEIGARELIDVVKTLDDANQVGAPA